MAEEVVKSIIRSVPPLNKLAKHVRKRLKDEILDETFYTMSPDALVAIVKAFNLQRQSAAGGRDLLHGHAYYEFGMYKGV